ncbi:YbaB/EbfC family nucleoid-associated protein [Nakamurella panacisegetis]|nr:YbaB/EbfC family nucleoid-associated protein [Nakamurella panacisegetis]
MPDLQSLLQHAQQMQADMAQAQADMAAAEFTGHAGSGLVQATVSGDGQLKALVIDPSVVDPTDVETLADLVIAAVRDATRAATESAEQTMGAMAGPPAGLDLSAFGLPTIDGFPADDDDDEFDDDDEDDAPAALPPSGA